jgi:hypothetical protein
MKIRLFMSGNGDAEWWLTAALEVVGRHAVAAERWIAAAGR